eukprot:12312693-Prorocentrum_lima.AAC.1
MEFSWRFLYCPDQAAAGLRADIMLESHTYYSLSCPSPPGHPHGPPLAAARSLTIMPSRGRSPRHGD